MKGESRGRKWGKEAEERTKGEREGKKETEERKEGETEGMKEGKIEVRNDNWTAGKKEEIVNLSGGNPIHLRGATRDSMGSTLPMINGSRKKKYGSEKRR